MPDSKTAQLIERMFWWLIGIFGSLFIAAATALVACLWNMNGSIVTLNERVGVVVERNQKQEERAERFEMTVASFRDELRGMAERLRRLEDAPRRK